MKIMSQTCNFVPSSKTPLNSSPQAGSHFAANTERLFLVDVKNFLFTLYSSALFPLSGNAARESFLNPYCT
jgi:hypothetical protein